jgi:ERCC4-type nuclease
MILVDSSKGSGDRNQGGVDLVPLIKGLGVQAVYDNLKYGDACFEGNGPDGPVYIGLERKSLHDILDCIDTARFSSHQMVGMRKTYTVSVVIVEGMWRLGSPPKMGGLLLESRGEGWFPCKNIGRNVLYSKLYRYLISLQFAGVIVTYSDTLYETAGQIVEWWHYFQKPFDQHTSLLEMQKIVVPSLTGRPSLVRQWAADIAGVGVKYAVEAEQLFKTPQALANADIDQWQKLVTDKGRGIGFKTALKIVRQIQGRE